MNLNNFTIKAQEAVQQAVQLATQNGQQAIETIHLLKGVIMTGKCDQFHLPETGCQYPESESCIGCADQFATEGIRRRTLSVK